MDGPSVVQVDRNTVHERIDEQSDNQERRDTNTGARRMQETGKDECYATD